MSIVSEYIKDAIIVELEIIIVYTIRMQVRVFIN